MDRNLLDLTIHKTKEKLMHWKSAEKAFGNPYAYTCELEDGTFFVLCTPKFPLDSTQYSFGWYKARTESSQEIDSPLFTWNTVEDDGSEDRSTESFVKDLFYLVHYTIEQETKPKSVDLSSVKMALEKVK